VTVKVLVWGTAQEGACAFYRGHLYDEPLRELGIEMRGINKLPTKLYARDRKGHFLPHDLSMDRFQAGIHSGEYTAKYQVNATDLEWCDVIMFRRYYNTFYACARCEFRTHAEQEARAHPHPLKMIGPMPARDELTPVVWEMAARQRNKGILYETDDLLLQAHTIKWNGIWPDVAMEEPRIRAMARRADLLTVSTPALARHMLPLNPRTRVIRNSVDPSLYVPNQPRPDGDKVRVAYYGSTVRMRDYAGYGNEITGKFEGGYPILAVRDYQKYLRTIFIGSQPQFEAVLRPLFDERYPFVESISGFARLLGNVHPDIGFAPVMGDHYFDRCKSELHWLEYTAAGAATIASRYSGDGPYNVIHDGVDGILARGRQEWHDGVKALLDKSRREDMAAAAMERLHRDYDYRQRAVEWADAFRWTAEHAGIGLTEDAA
jgi:glycosyltransferase involved in cell wall biosynthesis